MIAKKLYLCLDANIPSYRVTITSCDKQITKVVSGKTHLCLVTCSQKLTLIASPYNNYSTSLYYNLNTCIQKHNLYFNFFSRPLAPINIFTLTDKNYGLKINGALMFNKD